MSSLADLGERFNEKLSTVPGLMPHNQQAPDQRISSPSGWPNGSALAGSPCCNWRGGIPPLGHSGRPRAAMRAQEEGGSRPAQSFDVSQLGLVWLGSSMAPWPGVGWPVITFMVGVAGRSVWRHAQLWLCSWHVPFLAPGWCCKQPLMGNRGSQRPKEIC